MNNSIKIEKIIQDDIYGTAFFKFPEQDKESDTLYRANFSKCEDEFIPYKKGDIVDADLSIHCIDKFEKQDKITPTDFKQENFNDSSLSKAIVKVQKIGNEVYGIIDKIPQKLQLLLDIQKNDINALQDNDKIKIAGILDVFFDN